MRHIVWLVLFCSSFWSLCATPAQIEFTGQLKSVQKESDQVALLSMALTADFEILVRVTGATTILDENDRAITLSQLKLGTTLKINGLFTAKWILAREIQVREKENQFEIKGKIENVDVTNREIKVLGFIIRVPTTAEIKDDRGVPLSFSDLKLDQFVEVEGNISDNALVASEVEVQVPGRKLSRVDFEGTVISIQASDLQVEIEGVGPVLVHVGPDTKIDGLLAVGVLVRVSGTINEDLSVRAKKISVKKLLELVPDELEMAFNQTRTVEAILSKTFDQDISLNLLSSNPAIAGPSTPTLTIAAGKISGSFEVKSASIEGKTSIQAELPGSLGSQTATVKVEVEAKEDQKKELEVEWVPDELKARPNETKTVKLVLDLPAPSDLTVELSLKEGSSGLVTFPRQVVFARGSRVVEVVIQTGAAIGKGKIRATLPAVVGGDQDDLKVEIETEEQQKLEVKWVPDEIKARPNETKTVKLRLDRSAPSDLTAVLTLKKGPSDLVEFPNEVNFTKGSSETSVLIKTKNSTGKVKIRAALPFSVGGDHDDLEIEVEKEE